MPFVQGQAWCEQCRRMVLTQRRTPHHLIHLVLFVFTAMIWGIVWLVISIAASGEVARCQVCGGKALHAEDPEEVERRRAARAVKLKAFSRWAYPVFALVTLAALLLLMELFTRSTPG